MSGKQDLRIWINSPFVSCKTAIYWPDAEMTKKRHQKWIQVLEGSLRNNREFSDWLKQALEQGKRLRLKASVFGAPQRSGSACNVGVFLLSRRATEELSNFVEHK